MHGSLKTPRELHATRWGDERWATSMRPIVYSIVLVSTLLAGCEADPSFGKGAPAAPATPPKTTEPTKTTPPAPTPTPAAAPVAAKAAPAEPRVNGRGFTVVLPAGWEAKTSDPRSFGAVRGSSASIQIGAASNNAEKAKYLRAAAGGTECDAVFHDLAASMQLEEFTARKTAGCEREGHVAGITLAGSVVAIDARPFLVICGGGEDERSTWEPECRAIVASFRWDANAVAPTNVLPAAKTELTSDGRTRVRGPGVAVTLAPGWQIRPTSDESVAFAAMRDKGLGVISLGTIEAKLTMTPAGCREAAANISAAFNAKVSDTKLEGSRCVAAMDNATSVTEFMFTQGTKGKTLWLACVRNAKDSETAAECKSMFASLVFE